MKYEIDDKLVIRIYVEGNDAPILEQPDYPDFTPFVSVEEAAAWAELFIEAFENPEAPYAPAGPGLAGEPKSTERPEL